MPRSLSEIYRLLDKQAAFVFEISDGWWWIQRIFVKSRAYMPNNTVSQNRAVTTGKTSIPRPLNSCYPQHSVLLLAETFEMRKRILILCLLNWHVQNAVIPCRFQKPLPLLPVIHFFLSLLSADHSSILPHFIQPSISWSTSWSCCFQIHIQYSFGNHICAF